MEKSDYQKQGKKNREKGARFELKVRKHLEEMGFFVDKWTSNVDLEKSQLVPAKSNRFRSRQTGFPDFVAIMPKGQTNAPFTEDYRVIWIECKVNGYLKPLEREKIQWMLLEKMEVWVAYEKNKQIQYQKLMECDGSDRIRRSTIKNKVR